jgi:hypothetical protein
LGALLGKQAADPKICGEKLKTIVSNLPFSFKYFSGY